MTLAAVSRGLYFPCYDSPLAFSAGSTVDATGEKGAMIGRLYIDGRPTSAKTLSTGTIQWRAGTSTWANGSTTMDVGIQGVAAGSGPIAQPDGVYTVKTTLTGGAGLSSGAWNTTTMNSGSANLSHGDLVAVVWDMTNRAGADSVNIIGMRSAGYFGGAAGAGSIGFPITNSFVSSAWQTTNAAGAAQTPNVVIVFDDGTVGTLDGSYPATSVTTETYADATNPDERGMQFQVPWDCKIDGFWWWGGHTDASSDYSIKLYTDPTGTPSAVSGGTLSVLAEQGGIAAGTYLHVMSLATEIALTANTTYGLTMRATGSSNSRLLALTLGNTAHRAVYPGGTTLAKISRQNDTGAFSAESPALTIYGMGVRISQFHSAGGSAAGVIGS